MEFDGFDWDYGNKNKCQKHGVSISEVESIFYKKPLVAPDIKHSDQEQRFRTIGITLEGRYLFTIFTLRKKNNLIFIRPISARYMHKKETKNYEKEISKIQE